MRVLWMPVPPVLATIMGHVLHLHQTCLSVSALLVSQCSGSSSSSTSSGCCGSSNKETEIGGRIDR